MKVRWQISPIAIAAILVLASPAFPCSVGRSVSGIQIPIQMVEQADLILRVTAVEYATQPPGNTRTTGIPDTKVRFSVEEKVKGTYASKEIVLAGYLSNQDDWNDQPAPYSFVRTNGRSGSCFANTYKTAGQFLLLLKRNAASQSGPFATDTEYTVNWYALGPVNEQLHSTSDPWLVWVREQAAK